MEPKALIRIEQLAFELAELLNEHYEFQYDEAPMDLINELDDIAYAATMALEEE